MTALKIAGILVLCVTALAGAVPAQACGTIRVYAGTYLRSEQKFADQEIRRRCQLRMMGALLCVDRNYLREPQARRLLRAALAHAENSGDARLQCAGKLVARYFSVQPAKEPDTAAPALEELVKSMHDYTSFCKPESLDQDSLAISDLPPPAHSMWQCLPK